MKLKSVKGFRTSGVLVVAEDVGTRVRTKIIHTNNFFFMVSTTNY